MVSTRSSSPLRQPPTPGSASIPLTPLGPTTTNAPTVPSSSSTSTAAPPPASSSSSAPVLSIDTLLGIITTTNYDNKNAVSALQTTLNTALDPILASFLQDSQGKDTIDPLLCLDASRHTIGYLFILTNRLKVEYSTSNPAYLHQLFDYGQILCKTQDTRQFTSKVAWKVNSFSHRFLGLAKYLGRTSDICYSLHSLLLAWTFNNLSNFTAIHQDFVEACVASKEYTWASEVTLVPIEKFFVDYYDVTYLDFLRYNYLAGVAAGCSKNWEAAEGFFESAVSAPSTTASWVQIAAYKKLVLVQLIKDGKTTPLPKYVSASVTRAIKQHASTYKNFAESFEGSYGRGGKLLTSADKEIFAKDKNYGLVLASVDTALSRQIIKLTKTYEKLLVPEMAKLLGLEGAETSKVQTELTDEIFRMISSTPFLLNASISHHPSSLVPIITFLPPRETYIGPSTIVRLELLNAEASRLNEQVWEDDRRVGKSLKYLQKAAKEENTWGLGGAPGGGGAGMGLGMEEDLMEGFGGVGSRKTYDDNF